MVYLGRKRISFLLLVLMLVMSSNFGTAAASGGKTYTTDADFSSGKSINLSNKISGQLQLDDTTKPFGFIWVAISSKGTVVKINTETGEVLGEYKTAPDGQPKDPSRTTVDKNGSVWVTNRAGNSVTRIVLPESGLWIDKNGNGKCDTSIGFGDIKSWKNTNGADTNGGVSTAEDECIINYVRVSSYGTRHVSVDKNNDVWVSGTGNRIFDLIDGVTGTIKRTEGPVGYGGYGGLIDKNNVIWSSNSLLRWDTTKPLSGPNGTNWKGYYHNSYGLGIDSQGNVWNTSLSGNQIRKFAPDGTLLGTFGHGNYYAQGCVADSNGDIWIAHSLWGNTVGHIKNDGTYVGKVTVGSGPTGVAVDANGKIWVTNYYSRTVSRIDPNAGPMGADGVTRVGAVDFTTPDLGGNLYNYSDMTGSTLIGAPNFGSWSVVYDSGQPNNDWGTLNWNGLVSGDGSLTVTVESSNDNVSFSPKETVQSGDTMNVPDGQYLRVTVNFKRSSSGESPILYDLTIGTAEEPKSGASFGVGFIDLPAGTYAADPMWAGTASFMFDASYLDSIPYPIGQFNLNFADSDFLSLSYDLLDVSSDKVQFSGTGIINGEGNYGFVVSALDGIFNDGIDKIRIKIWNIDTGEIVFDNQPGEVDSASPVSVVNDGNIVISE